MDTKTEKRTDRVYHFEITPRDISFHFWRHAYDRSNYNVSLIQTGFICLEFYERVDLHALRA